MKVIGFLGLGALLAACLYGKLALPSVILASFLLLLAIGPRFDYWVAKRRFRKSPFHNVVGNRDAMDGNAVYSTRRPLWLPGAKPSAIPSAAALFAQRC